MTTADFINPFVQFREQLYRNFSQRADSLMDLLDALCANNGANSVVELSLNPLFRRAHGALYAAIGSLTESRDVVTGSECPDGSPPQHRFPQAWIEAIAPVVPVPT